jgi:hypothetical protein
MPKSYQSRPLINIECRRRWHECQRGTQECVRHNGFIKLSDIAIPTYANCFLIGRSRIRLPVAAKIALQMAGDMGGTPGSPTPAGGSELGTI